MRTEGLRRGPSRQNPERAMGTTFSRTRFGRVEALLGSSLCRARGGSGCGGARQSAPRDAGRDAWPAGSRAQGAHPAEHLTAISMVRWLVFRPPPKILDDFGARVYLALIDEIGVRGERSGAPALSRTRRSNGESS